MSSQAPSQRNAKQQYNKLAGEFKGKQDNAVANASRDFENAKQSALAAATRGKQQLNKMKGPSQSYLRSFVAFMYDAAGALAGAVSGAVYAVQSLFTAAQQQLQGASKKAKKSA